MKVKKLVPALLILVGLGISACQNNNSASESNHKSSSSKSIKIRKVKPKKSKKSEKAETAESNASSSASSSLSTNATTQTRKDPYPNLPGSDGLFDIPSTLQGTWYALSNEADDGSQVDLHIIKVTFDQHAMYGDNGERKYQTFLYKQKSDFDALKYVDEQEKFSEVGKGQILNYKNHIGINIRGWLQTAGDGMYYYRTVEEGQEVLVEAVGAQILATKIYWKTPELARQHVSDDQYDDIDYLSDTQ